MVAIGDTIPADTKFQYCPYNAEAEAKGICPMPITLDANKEWADKKVVLFAVPGAFTPTCSEGHLPGYIKKLAEVKAKGVDVVAALAFNDAFVMNGWRKDHGVKTGDLLFLSDVDTKFSKAIGWNLGDRTARYALVLDKGKVVYAAKEDSPKEVSVSSVDSVLAKL